MSTAAFPATTFNPSTGDNPGLDPGENTIGDWPAARTAAAFTAAVESGRLNLPLHRGGRNRARWAALADLAEEDLSLARLAEGHVDALAILAELGAAEAPTASRWGVWAAQPPGPGLAAGRYQALLLRRSFLHERAGDRDGTRREPAVRRQHAGPVSRPRQLARHPHGGQRHARPPLLRPSG